MSVVRFKFRCNILISGIFIKEMPGSVASGTHCIIHGVKGKGNIVPVDAKMLKMGV